MNSDTPPITKPQDIATAGEKLYADSFKEKFELEFAGQFAVIDVRTGKAYVAPFPEEALRKAQSEARGGLFHLIRIGSAGAFRASFISTAHARHDWVF